VTALGSEAQDRRREILELGRILHQAEAERRPVPQVSAGRPWLGQAEAYEVQQEIVRRRMAAGERVLGWKIGLTSQAMQRQLNVDQPDYAPILSRFIVPDGGTISTSELIAPRIEAEIGFVLEAPLRGPGVTAADVVAATAGLVAALEVIDSRIENWRLTLVDTISDLASSARVVASERRVPLEGVDLRALEVVLRRDGEEVGRGVGAAVLGNPLEAMAWAANRLGELGTGFEAGQLVIPGALHASVPVTAGTTFTASFDRLGDVSVRFE
jgi:2-keto-4-pentenoate hydratase